MMKWIRELVLSIMLVFLLLFIFLLSPLGLTTSIKIAKKFIPGTLHYQKISGNIFSPINIEDLDYDSKDFQIKIHKAHLVWRLPMFLLGDLDVAELKADKVIIVDKGPSYLKELNNNSKLPIGFIAENISVAQLIYQTDDPKFEPVEIKKISAEEFHLTNSKLNGKIFFQLNQPRTIKSKIILKGSLKKYDFTCDVSFPEASFTLSGEGDLQAATFNLQDRTSQIGQFHGQVKLQWYPYLRWNGKLALFNTQLAKFDSRLPLIQHFVFSSKGNWKKQLPEFDIDAKLKLAGMDVVVVGNHRHGWDLRWDAVITNFANLYRPFRGRVITSGTIKGDDMRPLLQANFSADNLSLNRLYADAINGNALVDFSLKRGSQIQLFAKNFYAPGFSVAEMNISSQASEQLRHVQTSINLKLANKTLLNLVAKLDGAVHNQSWHGKLQQFTLSNNQNATWKLTHPVQLDLAQSAITLEQSCWQSNLGQACLVANWDESKPWKIIGSAKLATLNSFSKLFYPEISINTKAKLKFAIDGNAKTLTQVNLSLLSEPGTISYPRNFKTQTVPIQKIAVIVQSQQHTLSAQGIINLSANNFLHADFTVPDFFTKEDFENQMLQGQVQVQFSELQLLEAFVPNLADPKGNIHGQFNFRGTLADPIIQGSLALQNGSVDIPDLKIQLKNIRMQLTAANHVANYHLTATSGEKPLYLDGMTNLVDGKLMTTIKVTGNDILISNTPEYVVFISPNLSIKIIGHGIAVSGEILVPRATIKTADFSNTVDLPDDIIIVNKDKSIEKSNWNWLLNITIKLGDGVFVDSHGLQGQVLGSIDLIRSSNASDAIANGQLRLKDAFFDAQGKKLTVSSGSSINYLHDPLNNPHLNFNASRTVSITATTSPITGLSKIDVGIQIQGTVKQPEVTLFSSPISLSQADILSYMLFDQPSTGNTTASNLALLVQAIGTLKIGKNSNGSSISQIKQTLGIAELGVQQQTYIDALGTPLGVNQSSFVIGKYLTPKIYLRYTRGLLTVISIYQVQYLINRNWSIQAEATSQSGGPQQPTTTGSGIDILYTISRKTFP